MSVERELYKAVTQKGYRYIALVSTRWRELGAGAVYLSKKEIDGHGLVVIESHPTAGLLLDSNAVCTDLFDVISISSNKDSGIFQKVSKAFWAWRLSRVSVGSTVYIASSTAPGAFFNILSFLSRPGSFSYIQLDEGVGTYLCDDRGWEQIRRRETGGSPRIVERYICMNLRNSLQLDRYLLFSDDGTPNWEVIEGYKRILQFHRSSEKNICFSSNEILFCTGPYQEEGLVSYEKYFILLSTIKQIIDSIGLKIVVKPHPREKDCSIYGRLGFKVLAEPNESIEAVLNNSSTSPMAIMGFTSTALVTSRLLFNLKAICIVDLFSDIFKPVKSVDYIIRYKDFFRRIVEFPECVDKFKHILVDEVLNQR